MALWNSQSLGTASSVIRRQECSWLIHSMTIAHQMLSLVGSLQSDPFSPAHSMALAPTKEEARIEPAKAGRAPRGVVPDEDEDEAAFPEDVFGGDEAGDDAEVPEEDEEEAADPVDTFAALGALADADVAAARAEREARERDEAEQKQLARAKAEKREKKERKRKAREEGREDSQKRRKEQAE
jgi:DNA-directed RNA polymerase I subunit RPA43